MRTATLHVHHIVPRSKGGLSTLENLLTLCEVCHPLIESEARSFMDEAISYRERPFAKARDRDASRPEHP